MKNFKMTIAYEGTHFNGWQKQKDRKYRTVQEEIEKVLSGMHQGEVKIIGAGRTDARVHALGQVASLKGDFKIPVDKIATVLNNRLPKDIYIKSFELKPDDFHARYQAKGKRYVYKIYNAPEKNIFMRDFYYWIEEPLDVEKMEAAAQYLVGTHDFRGFMASGSSIKTTIRTVHAIDFNIKRQGEGRVIEIAVEGNGFLYNMVRIIAGTLIDIGKHKVGPEAIIKALDLKDRKYSGHTAEPQGLYLNEVFY